MGGSLIAMIGITLLLTLLVGVCGYILFGSRDAS